MPIRTRWKKGGIDRLSVGGKRKIEGREKTRSRVKGGLHDRKKSKKVSNLVLLDGGQTQARGKVMNGGSIEEAETNAEPGEL